MVRQKIIPVAELKATTHEIVFDLPAAINEGIGKLIMTHAILETQVSELLYDATQIAYPAGRVAFGYKNAWDNFKIVITLIDMHGIKPSIDLNNLKDQIEDCCTARDTFAHNVWLKDKSGNMGIRIAKGTLETPEGKHNRKFIPRADAVPEGFFKNTVEAIKSTIAVVLDLKKQVKEELEKRKGGLT